MKKKVKTILLQDISKVGKKYDLKELANGYAHYLYKNKQIEFYNQKSWTEIEKAKALEKERELAIFAETQILQKRLNQLTLTFTLTKNQKGEVLGSIGFQEIASELKKSEIILAKKHLPSDFHSLNKVGEHIVPLKLGSDLVARLKIIIK